jgi:hypothetical protein
MTQSLWSVKKQPIHVVKNDEDEIEKKIGRKKSQNFLPNPGLKLNYVRVALI